MKKLLFFILITILFASCYDKSPNSDNSGNTEQPKDTLALITNHIVTDVEGLFSALEISDKFDTITIADRIDCIEPILIKNKENLLIHGDYAELCLSDSTNSYIIIDSCKNIVIEGLNLYFQNKNKTTPPLIHVKSGKNIVLKKNRLHNSGTYGIKADKTTDSLFIEENDISDCMQYGISSCASNTHISKNTFSNNRDGFSDYYICKEMQISAVIDTNYCLIANYNNYVNQLNEEINSGILEEIESMSPEGIEKTIGYFENGVLIHLDYKYSEETEENWKIYFKEGKLIYIHHTNSIEKINNVGAVVNTLQINEYFYINDKLVKWQTSNNENDIAIIDPKEYPKKYNELNITVNSLVGLLPVSEVNEIQ